MNGFLQNAPVQVNNYVMIASKANIRLSFLLHFMKFPNHLHFQVIFYQ